TRVTLTGRGFVGGAQRTRIYVGDTLVTAESTKVISPEKLEFVTPPGQLGPKNVRVDLDNGQSATANESFEYLQPVKANIEGENETFYDITVDPTGTYLIAAAGSGGIVIYSIDSSTLTANTECVSNPDDLLRKVDCNGDGEDDRVLTRIRLPNGYAALGVDSYFENNQDRLFVSAARLGTPPSDAHLFILAIDSEDVTRSTLVKSLPLDASYAKGVIVDNNQALVALAERGLGVVDTYLHTKTYLTDSIALPGNKKALDVDRVPPVVGQNAVYAVVGGEYNFKTFKLQEKETHNSGGFQLIERHPEYGLRLRGSLDISASHVTVVGQLAYLAAGDAGLVIIDIEDVENPRVISRVNNIGYVYDIAVNGNTAYVALGSRGILTVDVTDPSKPMRMGGFENYGNSFVQVVE